MFTKFSNNNYKFDVEGRNPGFVHSAKIKDINWQTQIQSRGGVIPYTLYNGQIYFCLGKDRQSGDLTDFGGGIKKYEGRVSGALREFREESLNVFSQCDKLDINDQLVFYSKKMLIILMKCDIDPIEISNFFENKVKNEVNPEIEDIVWISKDELLNLLYSDQQDKEGRIMYTKVRFFLKQVSNIIKNI